MGAVFRLFAWTVVVAGLAYLYGSDHGWKNCRSTITADFKEHLAHPDLGPVWIGDIRLEMVNQSRAYYKVTTK